MALIKCKDCGKEVSKDATACPECGNDIQKQIKREKEKEHQKQQKIKEKREQEKERQIMDWRLKGELCPWCNKHSVEDICPSCKKSKNDYENGTSCRWCGTKSVKNKCPNCGKNKMLVNFIIYFIGLVIIGGIIIFFVQACSDAANSGPTEEEARKWQNCSNRSNTYQKCSWNHWEDRCVCKLR